MQRRNKMKVKRLKELKFSYDKDEYNYPYSINGNTDHAHLTKREALSFVRFVLENVELTLEQKKDLYKYIPHCNGLQMINGKVCPVCNGEGWVEEEV